MNDEAESAEEGTYVIALGPDTPQMVRDAVRSGDMAPVHDALNRLRDGRILIFKRLREAENDKRRQKLQEYLIESRASEADLAAEVRAARTELHSDRMAKAAWTTVGVAVATMIVTSAVTIIVALNAPTPVVKNIIPTPPPTPGVANTAGAPAPRPSATVPPPTAPAPSHDGTRPSVSPSP